MFGFVVKPLEPKHHLGPKGTYCRDGINNVRTQSKSEECSALLEYNAAVSVGFDWKLRGQIEGAPDNLVSNLKGKLIFAHLKSVCRSLELLSM